MWFTAWENCTAASLPDPVPPETETGQPDQAGSCVGHPIIPATGEKVLLQSDYEGAGSAPLSLIRSYRSSRVVGAVTGAATAGLGQTWSHNHAVSIKQEGTAGSADSTARVLLGDGSVRAFSWNVATGSWVATNGADTLTQGAVGLLYKRLDDDSTWQFDAAGKLLTMTQRNGWVTTYAYSDATTSAGIAPRTGLLIRVVNQFGRMLSLSYDAAGQLSTVTTPDGQAIRYTFDSALRLIGVGYPGNTSKSYLYEDAVWPNFITGVVDERGIRLATYAYDTQGRGISTEHAGGADRYTLVYGVTPTDPVQVTDPLGTQRSYTYGTALNKLAVTGATLPSGSGGSDAASRVQNASGLIDSETDFLGVQTMFTWDVTRRLPVSTTVASGRPEAQTSSTQWHPTFRLPVLVTEPGRTTAFTYDAQGNTLSQTVTDTATGQSRIWVWTYNAQGLTATSTDPRGGISVFTYDTSGNLTSLKNPLGQEARYTYDGAGRVVGQTDPNGLLTSYAYDLRGRVLQVTRGTELTAFSYTPSGQINSLTLPNGYAIAYNYDAAQRLTAATDNRGNSVAYTLDAMGNRVREEVKDASGALAQVIARAINSLNRVAAINGAAGQTTQYGYDANGEPVSQTDPLNQTTRQTLDALRRPVATTLADNSSANLVWNPLDQLSSATDPKGVPTQYSRNAWGEVLRETSPDIGSINYQRDASGNIAASTDAKGQTTQITRDALGRPSQVTLADGKTQQFAFDSAGNVNQILDASGSTDYSLDSLGRILQKTQTVSDNPASPSAYSVHYQYHPGGGVAQISYPSGLKVYYRKNGSGQISQIDVQPPGRDKPITPFVTGLAYTALNQPKAWAWNNGDTASRSFDADARMTQNEFASYGYDAASRITRLTQNLWTSEGAKTYPTAMNWSAGYDSRNRLTSFTRNSAAATYSYDANSNRLTAIEKITSDTDLDGDFDQADFSKATSQSLYVDPGSNKLLGFSQTLTSTKGSKTKSSTSQINYSLDAAGNLTSDGLRVFDYDAANRLSQVQLNQHGEAARISYLHNALGQRVFKSEPQMTHTVPDEAELGQDFTTWLKKSFGWLFAKAQHNATLGQSYVYDDANVGASPNLLGEYGNGGSRSNGRTEYIWLPTEDGQSIPIGLFKGGNFYAVHADHINTPRLITNEDNRVVWQWPYSAFGNNLPSGILKATANPKAALTEDSASRAQLKRTSPSLEVNLRYPGQYFDEESNLNYNYFRSYDPGKGRYSQPDPIGLDGGWNRFSYVGGNPLSHIDPLGLDATKLNNTSGGRSRVDGPTNGNWGGKCWSGGKYSCGPGNGPGTARPTDSGDACYQRHDTCYVTCGANQSCIKTCDQVLKKELLDLPFDPRKWPMPPKPGTERDTIQFSNAAQGYF
ncbi:MAG: RHS repeat-associated core domain-containing protein [Rhodoferax sp.]|nr:RHS repeat-associated core domain-containing protein [Rhodoferax sp.]